jgi:hopanoid biosynthesis associated RND transporter like protein HpnN
VTFAVLFVGLGIDYSIQFCLRYRELIDRGTGQIEAVKATAAGVGRALFLSCITTAFGFYAFLPTPYEGVAELGLISGTGMFISFFMNLTLLPALLMSMPLKKAQRRRIELLPRFSFPYRHARAICMIALVIGLAAATALPSVYFDYNPLNLYDQSSDAIIAIKEMFDYPDMPPWTISVLAASEQDARRVASKLNGVAEVKAAATIHDFVPEDQDEKMEIISDMALLMQRPPEKEPKRLDYETKLAALDGFEAGLRRLNESGAGRQEHIERLLKAIGVFKASFKTPEAGRAAFDRLEQGLFSGLPGLLRRLDELLHPSRVEMKDIPEDIVKQYVSAQGYYRVQVFPRGNMLDADALGAFVDAVRAVEPDAIDTPVTLYETGKVVSSSFRLATLLALVAVVLALLAELRSLKVTALILLPLALSILLTAAFSVICSIPLNFANVIVLPLLIGVGVHSGIMFMIRYLGEPPEDGNMIGTSTAKAVFLSSLTMIISAGTLMFSNHRGIFGMGALLTVCFTLLLVSIIALLPALTVLFCREGGE